MLSKPAIGLPPHDACRVLRPDSCSHPDAQHDSDVAPIALRPTPVLIEFLLMLAQEQRAQQGLRLPDPGPQQGSRLGPGDPPDTPPERVQQGPPVGGAGEQRAGVGSGNAWWLGCARCSAMPKRGDLQLPGDFAPLHCLLMLYV